MPGRPSFKVKLDSGGMRELLQLDELRDVVLDAADKIAAHAEADAAVQRHGATVAVDTYTTDRAAASVTLKHAGGRGIEAKYGPLTKGAGAAGLQVRAR